MESLISEIMYIVFFVCGLCNWPCSALMAHHVPSCPGVAKSPVRLVAAILQSAGGSNSDDSISFILFIPKLRKLKRQSGNNFE